MAKIINSIKAMEEMEIPTFNKISEPYAYDNDLNQIDLIYKTFTENGELYIPYCVPSAWRSAIKKNTLYFRIPKEVIKELIDYYKENE